jgi:hypothetical protein
MSTVTATEPRTRPSRGGSGRGVRSVEGGNSPVRRRGDDRAARHRRRRKLLEAGLDTVMEAAKQSVRARPGGPSRSPGRDNSVQFQIAHSSRP